MQNRRKTHYKAALWILRYLKETVDLGFTLKNAGKWDLLTFTDSHYGGSLVNSTSMIGYCILLGGNLVTWRSKKQ